MIRILNIGLIFTVIFLISALYNIRYKADSYVRNIQTLQHTIKVEQNTRQILSAEWVSLNNPERLEMLARQELALEPVQFSQIVKLPNMLEFGHVVPASSHLLWKNF